MAGSPGDGGVNWAATRDEDASIDDVLSEEDDGYRVLPDIDAAGVDAAVAGAREVYEYLTGEEPLPHTKIEVYLKGHKGSTKRAMLLLSGKTSGSDPHEPNLEEKVEAGIEDFLEAEGETVPPGNLAERFRREVYELVHNEQVQLTALASCLPEMDPGIQKVAEHLVRGRDSGETYVPETVGDKRHLAREVTEELVHDLDEVGSARDIIRMSYQRGEIGMYPVGRPVNGHKVPYEEKTIALPEGYVEGLAL